MGSVSATNDNITLLSQDADNDIGQEIISTGNDDSNLKEMENTTLKTPVSGDTFGDVQTVIDSAASGDTIELDGFYKGSGTAILIDKDNLTILGNDATLDAQGQSRIFNITGTGVILKNINFINGNVTDNGGAIYWDADNGIISGCNFENNTATGIGGAVYWYGVNGLVNNSNFINNMVKRGGGAIYFDSNSVNGTVDKCNFTNNMATQKGGAVFWSGVNGKINNSKFTNSTSISGGAIFWDSSASNGALNDCNFIKNKGDDGGAIYWFGAYGRVNSCNFTNNEGTTGGAVNWQRTYGIVKNCNFAKNTAESNGGAIWWEGSNGTVTSCNFTNNNATGDGAVYWYAYNGTVNNSNFNDNEATDGGAIYWQSADGNISGYFKGNKARDSGCGSTIYFKEAFANVSISGTFINNTGNHLIYSEGSVSNSTIHDSIFINNSDINANIKITNSWFGNNQTDYNIKPDVGTNVSMTDWLFLNATYNINTTLQVAEVTFKLYSYSAGVSEYDNSLMQPITLKLSSLTGKADKNIIGLNEQVIFTPNDIGASSLKASFENTTETVEFEFKKENISLSINIGPEVISYGDNVKILLNYPNTATGKINITLMGKTYLKTYNDLDLNSTILLSETINPDTYNVTVVYSGNSLFNNATATSTLIVNKQTTIILTEPVIIVYNKDGYLIASLKDKNNKTISGVNLTVELNGVKNYNTDENGQVKVNVAKLPPGTYTVNIAFAGNEYYVKSSGSANVIVKKVKSIITAKKKTFKKSKKIKKYAIILKSEKTPIKKVKVTLKIKNKTYKAKTNSKGKAVFKIKKLTKKGTFKATIKFKGNAYYNAAAKKVKIKIK